MTFLIEYLGIIAIGLTLLVIYNRYKSGWFSKKQTNNQEAQETKPKSRFQQWWMQSYIREIYRVRASQRKLACFIPWVGVWISGFFILWYAVGIYLSLMHPHQPFEKLTKYDGVVKGYVYHRKGDDILVVQLPNGDKKYFHTVLRKKKTMDEWMDKNASVWVQKEYGILYGNYEWTQVVDINGNTVIGNKTVDRVVTNKKYLDNGISGLSYSLTWLFGFLGLLWFINRNPVIK